MGNRKVRKVVIAGMLLSVVCAAQAMNNFGSQQGEGSDKILERRRIREEKERSIRNYWILEWERRAASKEQYDRMTPEEKEIQEKIAWECRKGMEKDIINGD